MTKVRWYSKEKLFPAAKSKIKPAEVVLDIGCGIQPQQLIKPDVHICCEPFKQYVEALKIKTKDVNDRIFVFINATWEEATRLFPERSVDSIFLLDVIEHLEKEEALRLIRLTEKIAKRQVIIFTTLGFIPQSHPDGKDAWGMDGGKWQEHKSGWMPEDFGDGWEILVSKDFHTEDNLGRPYKTPYGALWAIKTLKFDEDKKKKTTSRRVAIHRFVDRIIDIVVK